MPKIKIKNSRQSHIGLNSRNTITYKRTLHQDLDNVSS